MFGRSWSSAGAILAAHLFSTSVAGADELNDRAAEAYDRGASAQARGDFAVAAREFSRADDLVPSDVALLAGLGAAFRADDAVLTMELAERAARSTKPNIVELAAKARQRAAGRVGRLHVTCPLPCEVLVDDAPLASSWLLTGSHRVIFVRDGKRETHTVQVAPRSIIELTPSSATTEAHASKPVAVAPPERLTNVEDRREPAQASNGISPWWLSAGVGVAALLGTGAGVSWAAASSKKDDFAAQNCARLGAPGCSELADEGGSAVTRTNVLLGAAAVALVATGVVAAFFVNWRPFRASTASSGAGFSF